MSRNGKNLWPEVARQVSTAGLEFWSHGIFLAGFEWLLLSSRHASSVTEGGAAGKSATLASNDPSQYFRLRLGFAHDFPRWNLEGSA